jgi:Mg2+ and Co2+ transporter CorA
MALRSQENDHILGPPLRNTQLSATNHGIAQANNAAQSANVLHSQYGSSMETLAARHDAMYALNELFLFAANSECQFINFMASQITLEMSTFEDHMMHSLQNLRFNKTLIGNHIAHLLKFVAFLKSSRPNARSKDEKINEVIHEAQDSLLRDYENLIERARDLAARCIEGASDITSKAMLEQSAQAIDESKRVNRLTLLAFFFLPVSLGTGIFGMNFKEFGTGILRIWVCIPVFVTILAISMVMAFPEAIMRPQKSRRLERSSSW